MINLISVNIERQLIAAQPQMMSKSIYSRTDTLLAFAHLVFTHQGSKFTQTFNMGHDTTP